MCIQPGQSFGLDDWAAFWIQEVSAQVQGFCGNARQCQYGGSQVEHGSLPMDCFVRMEASPNDNQVVALLFCIKERPNFGDSSGLVIALKHNNDVWVLLSDVLNE